MKRPNLCLIDIPECGGENESKLKNTLQDIIQENFPNRASPATGDWWKWRQNRPHARTGSVFHPQPGARTPCWPPFSQRLRRPL